ncbi:hypothetical protein TW81_02905 [Vibrio galatheae]|uniref:PilZ domain-containing protein n=1 Tax=Vibrio galatheae TaxID=579748 RepID=A0A0F4NNP8_9VIBR|nr:PilZ domain-containing protein [Vibrio galatheae]KJY84494.1 hypothetical protein TW81_02905 [Vibrio galatheae]
MSLVQRNSDDLNELQLSNNHQEQDTPLANKDVSSTDSSSAIHYGEDAFSNIMPLCEVACIVTTPTGKTLRCKTKYVGLHTNNVLLLELPNVSPKEKSQFMQRGYGIKACVISSKGEGARVYFKSKIEYVLSGGDSDLLLVGFPKATQVVVGLRESARLEVDLEGMISPNEHRYPCQLRDISQQGCLLVVERGKSNYRMGSIFDFKVLSSDESNKPYTEKQFSAVVRNVTKTNHYVRYGVKFEEECLKSVSELIEGLQFCSIQHKFTL